MMFNKVILRLIVKPLVVGMVFSLFLGSAMSVLASPDPSAPELLLSEIVVTPTGGEFIEIYNPTGGTVDLSNVYITDATYSGGGDFYYNIVTGANAGGGGFSDFHARFPSGASIASGSYQTIALAGSNDFFTEYGINPDYELFEDGGSPDSIPDMLEALPGSVNNQGGLSNSGEVVILYYWDGATDLVTDLDYAVWGDKAEAVDKTSVSIDGPDSDATSTTYLNDTLISLQDILAAGSHGSGNSWQRDDLTEGSEALTGGNGAGGDDESSEDLSNTWCEAGPTPKSASDCGPPPPPPFTTATIMEIQGSGQFSGFDGDFVETTGVVTLYTANGSHFWMQNPAGDGDLNTSDGIFVSGGAFPTVGNAPEIGDQIRVIAQVEEQQFGNALPLTRLVSVHTIEVSSSGNPLPTPVTLTDLPNESIVDGIAFWESMEGMLVSIIDAKVISPTTGFGEFAMITEFDSEPGSGYFPREKQIIIQELGGNLADYNPERILVDDSSLSDPIVVSPGDRVRSLVGIVDYTFGNYKLQPAEYEINTHKLPKLPVSNRSGSNGNLVITTFNVENLFDLDLNTPFVVDVIGQIGFDPGSQWGSGLTSTKDNTIRRQSSICQGDSEGADAFDPSLEWDGFPTDTFDGLGAHASSCGVVDELFISEYVEGASYNKVIEIFNGTGDAVNLGAEGYAVEIYFNGNSWSGRTILLSGTLADGDVFVLTHSSADGVILSEADQLSGDVLFNGDDAVVLRKGGKDDAGSTPLPEELETQLTKLAIAIRVELELPEIIVVQEVENTEILQALGDRVDASAGTAYKACSFETSDGRGIEVGLLWDSDRVDLQECYQLSGADVEAAFGPFSPSPGREPLVGVFEAKGEMITIIGNHFKSKGGDDPLFGVNWPPFRITEVQRKAQAQVVRDFVNSILDADPNTLVMVTGDLNDFQFGEPGEGSDHPVAILEGVGGGIPLVNLIEFEKDTERYTYVYDGNSQVLDHMLVSPALFDIFAGVDILHFNTSFPSYLENDSSTPLRSSDHDAVEGRFMIK